MNCFLRDKIFAYNCVVVIIIVVISDTIFGTALPNDINFALHLERENDIYNKIGIRAAESTKEGSILHENIYVTIVDADEDGKPVFRRWIPSRKDIKEAEQIYSDEKAKASVRINGHKITGVVDGISVLSTETGKKGQRLDYLIPERNISSLPQVTATASERVKAVVETVIVCDKEFSDIFGQNYQAILNYWVVYMWDVNMRYKSLPSNDISFQVNGIVVIANKAGQPFIEEARASDGRAEYGRILERYRSWVYAQMGNMPPFDMAPLVTNTNLEWGGGLAYLGAACGVDHNSKFHWGTLVFSDNGNWASVVVGAHEMGHNVGAPHDDEGDFPGGCSEKGYIMSGGENQYAFSSCSDRTISNFVRSDSGKCLRELSSNQPALSPGFHNPKAPSMLAQCKRILKNDGAWLGDDKDPSKCDTKICWQNNPNGEGGWSGVYFVPVDNTECANGGRCFRGFCRQPGQFFKNVGSGLCILATNPTTYGAPFEMATCPSPGTPLDRLLVKQGKSGSMLASQFMMGKEIGERCGYTGNAEGNIIWTDRCNEDNPWHGWDLQDVGNGQFLLKHRLTGRCAKPENGNTGSRIATYKLCDTKDASMKWQRLN